MGKRAFGVTNSEISVIIWIIGFLMSCLIVKIIFDILYPVLGDPGIGAGFGLILMLFMMNTIMSFASMALPNYMISKHNLNILIDRIKNPDFMGWIRYTRNKRLCFQVVKNGPLGQTKGIADGEKANIINDGSYTVITPCGNQAIIVNDLLSHNINLERAVGWNLINQHYGLVGFRAWEKAQDDGKLAYRHRLRFMDRKPLIKKEGVKDDR